MIETLIGSGILAVAAVVLVAGIGILLAFSWRVVVPTNMVHIVQSSRKTTSYGTTGSSGNTYYAFPAFIPMFGRTRLVLPVNNFSIRLDGYEAYDKDRAPFELDVIGFFVIADTNTAAQRAASFGELEAQLKSIMQGAARAVLAQHDINTIMGDRATFGKAFTDEVDQGLTAWGVKSVKNLELMDIRDAKGSKIILNIMAKKSSQIEAESRKVVAENHKQAEVAEIEARQIVELRQQEQQEVVGQRMADQEKNVGIAKEKANQEVQLQAKYTAERQMDVSRVNTVKQAEITRDAAVIKADELRQAQVIEANARKEQTVLVAAGNRDAALLQAEGIEAEGNAKGAAEQALLMAPVTAQITLAEKIAESKPYQDYLVRIREVEANEHVGVENAQALKDAEVKIIATAGSAGNGLTSVGEVFSPKGGVQLAAMLEAFIQTDAGKALIGKILGAK